ncbi:MAG: ABC transporter permease [Pseudomonadota bacterium]
MNLRAVWTIYIHEMARAIRTVGQSLVSPVITTSLYFVVFGTAIGSRIQIVDGVDYALFIVPGLIMLTILTQAVSNAAFGIFFPKFIGSVYELMSAPISFLEIVIGFVGAAATKSLIIGCVILATSMLFVDLQIEHPVWMFIILFITCIVFALLGFIVGIWAKSFEQLQLVPLLIITPLVFLGGSFYSISMLPPFWQTVSLFNPVVYLVSTYRWSFFGEADVNLWLSVSMIALFAALCLGIIWWMFRTGYRLRE